MTLSILVLVAFDYTDHYFLIKSNVKHIILAHIQKSHSKLVYLPDAT